MAASYWDSTQRRHWKFTKSQVQDFYRRLEENERMLVSQYPLPDRRLLNIYFSIQLNKLAKRMTIRQQAIATAQVYMRRYFTRVDIRRTNPYLVLSTAFYLACKVEECPHHIRLVAAEARQIWPDSGGSGGGGIATYEPSQLGECEFSIISELSSHLLLHHPYRSLNELQSASKLALTLDETSLAWNIINDHYLTDLPLLYPPYLIAVTAAFLAVALKPTQGSMQVHANAIQSALNNLGGSSSSGSSSSSSSSSGSGSGGPGGGGFGSLLGGGPPHTTSPRVHKVMNWIAESEVNIKDMIDITQELISLYEVWEGYKESVCKDPIARFIKSRGLEK